MSETIEKEKSEVIPKWQSNFTNYVTGTAFLISLTHNQVSMLKHIGHHQKITDWKSSSGYDTQVPTIKQLERRGLVEHNPAAKANAGLPVGVFPKWIFRLTPAGERVLELVEIMEQAQ